MLSIKFTTDLPVKQGAYLYRTTKHHCPVWVWYNVEHKNFMAMAPNTIPVRTPIDKVPEGAEFCFMYEESSATD